MQTARLRLLASRCMAHGRLALDALNISRHSLHISAELIALTAVRGMVMIYCIQKARLLVRTAGKAYPTSQGFLFLCGPCTINNQSTGGTRRSHDTGSHSYGPSDAVVLVTDRG